LNGILLVSVGLQSILRTGMSLAKNRPRGPTEDFDGTNASRIFKCRNAFGW
jgi:hypothetical protein